MIKSKKYFLFSLILLIAVFVYPFKSMARVHLLKYNGDFSILYQDVNLFGDNILPTQTQDVANVRSLFVVIFAIVFVLPAFSFIKITTTISNNSRSPPFLL